MSAVAASRVDAGVPAGGQFTTSTRGEAELTLTYEADPIVASVEREDRAAFEGVMESAGKWHSEWLSEIRDGNDYSPSEVDAVDREHLAQVEFMDELADRIADAPGALHLRASDIERLGEVFSSARQWHQEWKGYVRDGGDYDEAEALAGDRALEDQVKIMSALRRQAPPA